MKRLIALLIAAFLLVSVALAEDFQSMTGIMPGYKNHYDNHGHKVGYTRDSLLGKKTKIR